MKTKKILLLLLSIICFNVTKADEGMWLLSMLNELGIEQKGSKLTPEQIYSINNSSVKDAIVGLGESDNPFNFFCTAELVSDKGLALTNYHCAFDMIQDLSSLGSNYIDNGFWAMNNSEELLAKGVTATIVVKMIDVTDKIMPYYNIPGLSWQQIQDTIQYVSKQIRNTVSDTSRYFAAIEPFFEHNQYFMFVYEKFEDVRLVGAPPRTIGKFGGDTDNWMWPRHTGDFAVLRVYGKENKPAAYSAENKPITPRHHLPVSLQGYEKDDFTFVMGFPGSTDRYKTASGIEGLLEYNNKSVINIGDNMLALYKEYMSTSEEIRIKYSSKYDHMSNYWKYAIGQNKGIVALKVIENKMAQEKELQDWINADADRKAKYGKALKEIDNFYQSTNNIHYAQNYMNIGLLRAAEIYMYMFQMYEYVTALESGSAEEIAAAKQTAIDITNKYFKEYDASVDKAQFVKMSEIYKQNVNEKLYPAYFALVDKKYKGSFENYATKIYSKTMFVNKETMLAWIEKPDVKAFTKDPGFGLLRQTLGIYFTMDEVDGRFEVEKEYKLYLEALMAFKPDSLFYPDANSTIRYTYGYVGDYYPRDAVYYSYYTTIDGIIEKENPKSEEFEVPAKLKELYYAKDFGQYTNKKGELPVCFITNNDITGGNSGSPCMNAKGELIGLAFDGNWEAMSGDIIFENKYQKCIVVDIRYVLWVIDKLSGAGYLVEEMTVVK